MKRYALYAVLALTLPLAAQQATPTVRPHPTTPQPAPLDKPNTTELQDTQLELYQSKLDGINVVAQAESAPWRAKAQALIAAIEKSNPEYVWHNAQNQNDRSGWVHKPMPQLPPVPPAPPAAVPTPPATPKK